MYNFKHVEETVSKLWDKQIKEIKKSLKYDPKKNLYSFLEGPPTANAPPGLHHVEVRVFKDLFCRFKNMQGFTVPRKGGWDCHGLPVEVQIEKALKLNSKKDILNYGIEKFNRQCKESVFSYIKEWNKLTERMAFWIDLEHPYVTLENNYIESVWWSLKELYNKKMLYEGHKVVPFCPRCVDPNSIVFVEGPAKKLSDLKNCWRHNKTISFDLAKGKLQATPLSGYLEYENEDVWKIRTEGGRELIATADHPFLTKKGWKNLSELNIKEEVAVYHHPNPIEEQNESTVIIEEDKIQKILESFEINFGFRNNDSELRNLTSRMKLNLVESVQKLHQLRYSYKNIIKKIYELYKIRISKSWLSRAINREIWNRESYLLKELKKRNLLPLLSNSPSAPIIARLIGHILGDGCIPSSEENPAHKFSNLTIICTGQIEDLERIANDIKYIGFRASKISSRRIISRINGRIIDGISNELRVYSTPLAILLFALGAPIGKKSTQNFSVPPWLINSPKNLIKEFLSAYFGGELDIIKLKTHGNGPENLRFHLHKKEGYELSGKEFVQQIYKLLLGLGIKTSPITLKRAYINGKPTFKVSGKISGSNENIIKFAESIGYKYCKKREIRAAHMLAYLHIKRNKEKLWSDKKEEIKKLKATGLTHKEIAIKINAPLPFVKYVLSKKKDVKRIRVTKHILKFEEWLLDATKNLGDGVVWGRIDEIVYAGKMKVADVSVENLHNFIVNGFVTHNCETPLSSHEVALGYKDITEPAITIKFKVKDSKNRYFLAFTTTPWTTVSNVALVVNKKIDYAIIKSGNEEYILAESLIKKYFTDYKIIKKVKGKDLLELKYEPIFSYFKNLKNSFRVIHGDFVSVEEGTGVVHAAAAFGEDDFEVCKLNKIDFVKPIDETGHFTSEVADFKGMFVKDADPKIINYLDNKKILFKKENYTHTYPFCWRCDTPLIYYAMLSWFIKVRQFRKELLKNNEKINWYPKHIKEGRFGNWLEGAKDWALSRKKFWGTPLPIWRCNKCKNEIIVGSVKELKELSNIKKEIDLHKPFIDEVKIKCNKCTNIMARVSDVIDCWYDSGSAIFAQFHYPFENKELFEKNFPYNFIAEAIDQTRGWFYTLHVLAVLLFGKNAYDNVVCAGHIVDENGEKMSKSKGNIINPFETFDKVGVDAVRLQFCVNDVGDQKRFSLNLINQQVMPFLTILWNCYQYSKNLKSTKKPELHLEDKWILSRTNSLINEVTQELEKHNYHKCLSGFMNFVNEDLSRTYIKLIRERVDENDLTVGYVFNYVFERLSKLLAPFAPYISDYIYQSIESKSIHLTEWPLSDKKLIHKELEESLNNSKLVIQEILAQRNIEKIGVRWPLKEVTIKSSNNILDSVEELEDLIKKQVNSKKLKLVNAKEGIEIKLNTELTPELEKEGYTREVLRRIQDLRKKAKLNKEDKIELYISADVDLDFDLIKKITNAKIVKYFESNNSDGFNVKDNKFEVRIKKI